jgi:hypothetical protein
MTSEYRREIRALVALQVAKAVAIVAVLLAMCIGCGPPEESDDVAGLPKQLISWPLTGGLDTATAPLQVQAGSALTLDDVVQERLGEWRSRNGWTTNAADNLPAGIVPLVGKLGDAGFLALGDSFATYRPSLGSNRWTASTDINIGDDISNMAVVSTDSIIMGFATTGNLQMVAVLDSTAPAIVVFDAQGKTHSRIALTAGTYIRARCAATAGKLVAYLADTAGNLVTYIADVSTGVVTGPTTIKTGLHLTAPHLAARWDGSAATVTVVARLAAADALAFIEHNPATGALATNTTVAGVVADASVAIFQDFSNSGTRFVAASSTTGLVTKIMRISSAGVVATTDSVAMPFSGALTVVGVGYGAGAFYDAVMDGATSVLHTYRDGGGAHVTPVGLWFQTSLNKMTLDSEAYSHDGVTYQFLMGLHSINTGDPQDSWVNIALALGGATTFYEQSRVMPLQGCEAPSNIANSIPFQRVPVSAHVSAWAAPVLASYTLASGTTVRKYSVRSFTQQILASSDIATVVNKGGQVQFKSSSYVPGNSAAVVDEGGLRPIGTSAPPPAPWNITQTTGGAMTALATYSYLWVIESYTSDGNIWRSPPSSPTSVTLTGANNKTTVQIQPWPVMGVRSYGKLYRTSANGFLYRLVAAQRVFSGGSSAISIVDGAADTAIASSEVLYTTGELATAITPRFSHVAIFKGRLWGINADVRGELWPSKTLRPGRQPEFTNESVITIDDNFGDGTGFGVIDDNGVFFKRNAIYFVQGDGLNDDGSGTQHTFVQVSADIGAIPGSPIVNAGDAIYFVSDRGIYSVDRGGNVVFVGLPVDRYINQPLVQTPERIWDACYVAATNEVRFVTDNYILVHNRKFQTSGTALVASSGAYWSRWNIAGGRRCLVVNNKMVLFKSDGTVWREGDQTQLTDNGAAINGVIRCAWIRAAGFDGRIRLKRLRLTGTRTAGGGNISPTLKLYFDNDDNNTEGPFAPQAAIAAGTTPVLAEIMPRTHQLTAFSAQVNFPSGDNTFRIDGFSAEVGVKPGSIRNVGTAGRWQ